MFSRLIVAFLALTTAVPLSAAELGDDGLHKADWMRETFLDLREDLEEANAEGKRLMVIIEQRGCIYCTKMHEEVFPIPEIDATLHDSYFVVQLNLFGDLEVTDFDGSVLSEKDMAQRWNVLFTPTMMFLPQEVDADQTAQQAAVAVVPGAFGRWTTQNLLNWVQEEGYLGDETFQRYHARILQEKGITE
ncbi:Thioredoxin-like domain-containing protein [Cognatiyoonia koreensis]|uniref:Thioredoxin-like domain-containing protein n=1 Tax=Cognatiyoonia koreensis TaxID=364200 RepID=A0A1I0PYB1_9RHOB|nr:thioredoxin family protein [Cognatiyoonia koreensis]SEW19529.1 Thioredoxin-like domain-containing protein [Cognatiyoonia koreensis]